MTNIPADDTRLIMLIGELSGDVKALLRAQEQMNERISGHEDRMNTQIENLSKRVASLEAIRTKVAGFTAALALVAGLLTEKVAGVFTKISNFIGG